MLDLPEQLGPLRTMQAAATDQASRKSASHHRACAIAWREHWSTAPFASIQHWFHRAKRGSLLLGPSGTARDARALTRRRDSSALPPGSRNGAVVSSVSHGTGALTAFVRQQSTGRDRG